MKALRLPRLTVRLMALLLLLQTGRIVAQQYFSIDRGITYYGNSPWDIQTQIDSARLNEKLRKQDAEEFQRSNDEIQAARTAYWSGVRAGKVDPAAASRYATLLAEKDIRLLTAYDMRGNFSLNVDPNKGPNAFSIIMTAAEVNFDGGVRPRAREEFYAWGFVAFEELREKKADNLFEHVANVMSVLGKARSLPEYEIYVRARNIAEYEATGLTTTLTDKEYLDYLIDGSNAGSPATFAVAKRALLEEVGEVELLKIAREIRGVPRASDGWLVIDGEGGMPPSHFKQRLLQRSPRVYNAMLALYLVHGNYRQPGHAVAGIWASAFEALRRIEFVYGRDAFAGIAAQFRQFFPEEPRFVLPQEADLRAQNGKAIMAYRTDLALALMLFENDPMGCLKSACYESGIPVESARARYEKLTATYTKQQIQEAVGQLIALISSEKSAQKNYLSFADERLSRTLLDVYNQSPEVDVRNFEEYAESFRRYSIWPPRIPSTRWEAYPRQWNWLRWHGAARLAVLEGILQGKCYASPDDPTWRVSPRYAEWSKYAMGSSVSLRVSYTRKGGGGTTRKNAAITLFLSDNKNEGELSFIRFQSVKGRTTRIELKQPRKEKIPAKGSTIGLAGAKPGDMSPYNFLFYVLGDFLHTITLPELEAYRAESATFQWGEKTYPGNRYIYEEARPALVYAFESGKAQYLLKHELLIAEGVAPLRGAPVYDRSAEEIYPGVPAEDAESGRKGSVRDMFNFWNSNVVQERLVCSLSESPYNSTDLLIELVDANLVDRKDGKPGGISVGELTAYHERIVTKHCPEALVDPDHKSPPTAPPGPAALPSSSSQPRSEAQTVLPDSKPTPVRPVAIASPSAPVATVYPDKPPRILNATMPGYPAELMKAPVKGTVEVEFVILANGKVAELKVLRSTRKEFEALATEAVQGCWFGPGQKDGKSVNVRVRLQIPFDPKKSRFLSGLQILR